MRTHARLVAAGASLGFAMLTTGARAYCPSYTPAETAGGQNCGVQPINGTNPDAVAWKAIFAKVAPGQASWGADGPSIGTMGAGCGAPTPKHDVPAHFPCHVMKAIAMQESGWKQFCVPDAPAASVGAPERTIVAFDCGYGIGQVTSGMHVGETPAFDRQRVAGDATYNLATGTLILRDKWIATKCVGDNNPDLVEDWYTAIWAYNGLAYSNNPNNPNLTAGRGPYNPANGGSYTYQERVLGWMEHPPTASHWSVLAPAYPNRGDIGGAGSPPALPEPSCASPTSCAQTRPTHTSPCDAAPQGDAGAPDAGSKDGGATDAAATDSGTIAAADASGGGDSGPAALAPGGASSGCACEATGRGGSGSGALFAALGMLAIAARRRRA